jgi:hypothetical protein
MFKALRVGGFTALQNTTYENLLKVANGNENYVFYGHSDTDSFDEEGYLTQPIALDWNGDGKALKQIAEDFGFEVDWDGGSFYKMTIKPASEEILATR